MSRNDKIDIVVEIHTLSDQAILVSDTGDERDAVWLPCSQIEYVTLKGVTTVTLPEWLAEAKGLI